MSYRPRLSTLHTGYIYRCSDPSFLCVYPSATAPVFGRHTSYRTKNKQTSSWFKYCLVTWDKIKSLTFSSHLGYVNMNLVQDPWTKHKPITYYFNSCQMQQNLDGYHKALTSRKKVTFKSYFPKDMTTIQLTALLICRPGLKRFCEDILSSTWHVNEKIQTQIFCSIVEVTIHLTTHLSKWDTLQNLYMTTTRIRDQIRADQDPLP